VNDLEDELARFTEYIVWVGRYPVSTTLVEPHPDGVRHVDLNVSDQDRVSFDKLFAIAKNTYEDHVSKSPRKGGS